ncbi:MAG TPA: DUF2157 domain-containing protein [Hymenobacter sp.]|uniref:DUF2157 domain-containing protein n=1 Tax=Hymenobacter sp. TaxID=1898978 RepID=UPI002D80C376|nr:DUF2157 domain-containing protein [Hymenobacter sp.]HET9505720.1 DUF2157 domain-containing protein [Hymenobacter sp.]
MPTPTTRLLAELEAAGYLPPAQAAAIAEDERARPFSLHYELRALLYLGITLLAGGVGVLIYQHIDSLGHGVIIGAIALAMSASFAYGVRRRLAFTWGEAPRTSIAADYLLVLGCLLFLVLEGYLQAQYELFGTRYGLATVLPAGLFFYLAYRFDHRGVLSLAITALAAWVGVSVAPLAVFQQALLWHSALSFPGMLLGLVLVAAGLGSEFLDRKRHFAFTYLSLGSNVTLLAALSLLFATEGRYSLPWLLLVLVLSAGLVWYARRAQSYLFLLMSVAYSYVAITYSIVRLLASGHSSDWVTPMLVFYLPLTLVGIVLLFLNSKKILRLA